MLVSFTLICHSLDGERSQAESARIARSASRGKAADCSDAAGAARSSHGGGVGQGIGAGRRGAPSDALVGAGAGAAVGESPGLAQRSWCARRRGMLGTKVAASESAPVDPHFRQGAIKGGRGHAS